MEIYLNKEVGKVYDLFSSLFITLNYDSYLKELEKYYMVEDKKFKNKLEDVRQAIEPDIEKYKCFFKPNPSLFSPFVPLHKMWQYKTIDSYIEYIKTLEEKEIDEFSCYLEKEIDEKGIEMEIPIYKYVDTNTIKTIYLVPSLFNEYSISQTVMQSKKESYIILGKSIDKVLFNKYRDDALDRNILVLKNLGDQSKYQFLKLLSEGEKYGQEIADNLGITSATINYHANNLIFANLIDVDRRENKAYFSLKKDALREMIRFIEKDFDL